MTVPVDPFTAAEQEALRLERAGEYRAALELCERTLAEHTFDPQDAVAARAEAQFSQRRLRLRRKLGLRTWSSQGVGF
ncbi:MAG TPA: hypothetical protein VH257_18680 [Chloroflexota bacterium]|nr:hypothetical protein [Chloroflexota bacterium]